MQLAVISSLSPVELAENRPKTVSVELWSIVKNTAAFASANRDEEH
jgi:hypothetical protein